MDSGARVPVALDWFFILETWYKIPTFLIYSRVSEIPYNFYHISEKTKILNIHYLLHYLQIIYNTSCFLMKNGLYVK